MAHVHGISIRDLSALTPAEKRLVEVYAANREKSFSQIAAMLGISPKSVAQQGKLIREKTGAKTLGEAVEVINGRA